MMEQSEQPLWNAIKKHRAKNSTSFHVPGHKSGKVASSQYGEQFSEFLSYDLTELNGLDDFHGPDGAIKEAQSLLTQYYKTEKSYFLVNGSTVGNLAMIFATCEEGDLVYVQRNCHKSILNALMIRNIRPIFLEPEVSEASYMPTGVSKYTLEEAVRKYPGGRACLFTYPTYYGETYDLKELIQFAHRNHIIVLVDEAHGPHLTIGHPFPQSSLRMNADIVVQSAHKMLPAMTMGSYLHVNHSSLPLNRIEFYLDALQSSSPSYPIMASLDIARSYLATFTVTDVAATMKERKKIVDFFVEQEGITIIEGIDPLKIIVRKQGWTGFQLQQWLERRHIFVELADPYQVLFSPSIIKKRRSITLY